MAGKDGAGKDGAPEGDPATDWLAAVFMKLRTEVEAVIEQVAARPLEREADDAAADRRARAIANLARAARYVAELTVRKVARPGVGATEEDMKDIDDIDPGELARIRADLESRLDHVRGLVEQKRMAGWAGAGTGDGGGAPAVAVALSPGRAAV